MHVPGTSANIKTGRRTDRYTDMLLTAKYCEVVIAPDTAADKHTDVRTDTDRLVTGGNTD